ncbi:MAG: hypothetical protein V1793_21990 [Pseudomonadota bacterium]
MDVTPGAGRNTILPDSVTDGQTRGVRLVRRNQHPAVQDGITADRFQDLLQASLDSKTLPGNTVNNEFSEQSHAPMMVEIGTIGPDGPTVSHLLCRSPYRKACWDIVHSDVNAGKPFRAIHTGTRVFMDIETRELVWDRVEPPAAPEGTAPVSPEHCKSPSPGKDPSGSLAKDGADMVNAVRSFIGTDYSKMDCFELLVGGLQNLGVQYRGRGGLGERLVQKAVDKGLALNRYMNGEGLVRTSGDNVFQKRFLRVINPDREAEEVMAEMSPVLQEGQILSFSMRTRGHTGVVSQRDGLWTFINSGTLDNTVSKTRVHKGVGEENLVAELKNWFRLAGEKKEGLQITVGSLNMNMLSAFSPSRSRGAEKA